MKRLALGILFAWTAFLGVQVWAQAQGPFTILLPGVKADYRFDYRGDGSEIRVGLDSSDAAAVSLTIFTPEQIQAQSRGQAVTPIGRGMPSREHDLYWAGAFRSFGVYHVYVENRSAAPISYRVQIAGDGVSSAALVASVSTPVPSNIITEGGRRYLVVALPPSVGSTLRLAMPNAPASCTPAKQIPAVISQSVKLCANEIYGPLRIAGSNVGLYADDGHTAVVNSVGRQFAITVEGSNNWIEGVTITARADPKDAGAFLCLYDECFFPTQPVSTTLRGGVGYGGGILLKGSNSTVHGVTVRGGTIGVATVDGRVNYLIDNQLNDLNGWGSFNVGSNGSYFVGNTWNRENHGCTTPDGRKFLTGCETSGWVCLNCQANVIARNHCELSGNCYYMSGERDLFSNDNRLVQNFCSGATDNCFELTFSLRNVLQENVSTLDVKTGQPCKYPFWIGGSVVYFKDNTWECAIAADTAFIQARDSTVVGTNIINVNQFNIPPGMPTIAAPTGRLKVLPDWGLEYVH